MIVVWWVQLFSCPPLLDCEINQVELIAAWSIIVWFCNRFGSILLWLEGNSLRVIELINEESDLHDDSILADCKTILRKQRAVRVTHIYREGNAGADMIGAFKLWECNFPSELIVIVERDRSMTYMRVWSCSISLFSCPFPKGNKALLLCPIHLLQYFTFTTSHKNKGVNEPTQES